MPDELPAGVTPTYSRQYRRCGKSNCPLCTAGGRGHGPYWYAYWRDGKRTRSRYLGKNPPHAVALAAPEEAGIVQTIAAPLPRPALRVQTLGAFAIWRGDRRLGVERWERQRIGELFKWLAGAPGHRLTRDEVVEQFWPEVAPDRGVANLRVLAHRLRKALDEPEGGPSCLLYDGEMLALAPDASTAATWLDATVFAVAARAALVGRAAVACRAALALYTGDYLPADAYEEWAVGRREELRQLRGRVLLHLAELSTASGEVEEAEAALHAVLEFDRCHEPAALALMRQYTAAGRPGQALRVYRRFADALRDELAIEPEDETLALARALAARRRPARALPEADSAPNNLPAPLTSFIGRRRELAELGALLRPVPPDQAGTGNEAGAPCRLLTLTGPGGVGKTRLALELADWLLDEPGACPDGVWLVELASLADPTHVPKAISQVLDIQEETARPLIDTIVTWLAGKRLLLVLDNCEHLVGACADLAAMLLASCRGLRVLATSRSTLGVSGEQLWAVPSLSLPDTGVTGPVGRLLESEAVRLFLERARVRRPGLSLTLENAEAVARICRQLDGIPLALELAAARVSVLSLEQVAARLGESFRLLRGGPRTSPARHQTLRATLDWSYDLLAEQERTLLRRLAVFAGGSTLEAVESICAGPVSSDPCSDRAVDLAVEEVLDLLDGLVHQSLVHMEDGQEGARYRMLETIRQYGRERLATAGEVPALEQRHAAYYLAQAEKAEPALTGVEQAGAMARLEREHDNLRSALQWSAQHDGGETGLRIAAALWRFWFTRGHIREGQRWLAVFVHARKARGAGPAPGLAKALNGAGALAYYVGDYASALDYYEEALSVYRRLDDKRGIAALLGNVGLVVKDQGDLARAMTLYEESLARYQEQGDNRGVANALNNLGIAAYEQGDYPRAATLHERSLALKRGLGDTRGIVTSLNNLGALALDQGDYARATVLHGESLELARTLGSNRSVIVSLINLGRAAYEQGDADRAIALYTQALNICWEFGDRLSLLNGLEGMANVARLRGAQRRAVQLYGAAEAVRAAISAPLEPLAAGDRATFQQSIAALRLGLGEQAFAEAWGAGRQLTVEQAVALATEV